MKKHKLLPILAIQGIAKNKELYVPYLGAGIFSAFLYFSFDTVLHHPVMRTIPRAEYAYMMLLIGFMLLHIIILPFLYYTYRFLVKRRKKELGLYSILGMEKRHIAMLMVLENMICVFLMVFGGVILGVVFSRLILLLFFYMQDLTVYSEFVFSGRAFLETAIFFFVSAIINLAYSLYSVGKSSPVELMSSSKKGEKKPKFIGIPAVLGVLLLAAGYTISVTSELNGMIFGNFFLAVFLVVIATYFLFTAASVVLLGFLKKRKSFYYRPSNFITVSGMYYRMKRSAAGLVNICIFSTMVIITLICTVSLSFGMDAISHATYPNDVELVIEPKNGEADRQKAEAYVRALEREYDIEEKYLYSYFFRQGSFQTESTGQTAELLRVEETTSWAQRRQFKLMTLSEYNRMTGENRELSEKEVFVYSDGADIGKAELSIMGERYAVKEELSAFPGTSKVSENNYSNRENWIIVREEKLLSEEAEKLFGEQQLRVLLSFEGEKHKRELFAAALCEKADFAYIKRNYVESDLDMRCACGGLLFIGVFFGLLFTICLLIIMYYKQITEGYEDRESFEIMQKVGMSHEEIRRTIVKQVLLVFFLPLFGAVCHTAAAVPMVTMLLGAIQLYDRSLIITGSFGVVAVFLLFYGISYVFTARTYMKIVERRV